jgi:hypothetical protein
MKQIMRHSLPLENKIYCDCFDKCLSEAADNYVTYLKSHFLVGIRTEP